MAKPLSTGINRSRATSLTSAALLFFSLAVEGQIRQVNWSRISSATGELPVPPVSGGQSGLRVVDLDKNGQNDYVLTLWSAPQTVVWYRHVGDRFDPYVIDTQTPNLSHGEGFKDIDGDGDIDLLFGDAAWSDKMYWWENPYPNYDPGAPWLRRMVRNGGGNFYHDNIWGDFDGDGQDELIAWNQYSQQLLFFEIPADPRNSGTWPVTPIFSWTGDPLEYRGAEAVDINLDGKMDFVGGGGWFEHTGGTSFVRRPIDDAMAYSQIKAGQLIEGGRPEVVTVLELVDGPLNLYTWTGSVWQKQTLLANITRSHTLQLGDINLDGHLDIVTAEMGQAYDPPPENPNARVFVLYGDGAGNFTQQIVFAGQGLLEGQLADINDDGRLDIIGNSFRMNTPRMDMWINEGFTPAPPQINSQPASLTVEEPNAATFTVTASGSVPLLYQWRRGGVPIGGATGSSYTLSPTSRTTDNGAQFSVVVSNSAGSVTSVVAMLTVTVPVPQPPQITTQPASVTVVEPAAASFSVTASGSSPLSYHWRRGGTPISGANNSSYTLSPTSQATDNGAQFSVVVSNASGSVTSVVATLTVAAPGSVPANGLALWLRADAGTVLNGSAVTQWTDQSSNNRNATQTSGANQPLLVSSAVNGLPAVRFDGVNDYLTFNLPVNGLGGMSIFLVAANTLNQDGVGSQAERAALFWNETAFWGTVYLSPFQSAVNFRFGTTQSDNRTIYTRPTSVGSDFTLSTAVKNGTTDSLYVNGTLAVSQGGKLATIAGCRDTGNLGRGYDDNTYYAGDIAEVLVYSRALSSAERVAVEQYLDSKYRLTTPAPPQITSTAVSNAAAASEPRLRLYIEVDANGNKVIHHNGAGLGLSLHIQYSDDYINWLTLGGGPHPSPVTVPSSSAMRFYRAVIDP